MTGGGFGLAGHLGLSGPDRPLLAHLGRSADPLDQIDALADHGFVGVQDLFLKLRSEREQAAMAARMARRGLALSSFGGDPRDWNTPLWSREDAAGRAAQAASVRDSAALAMRFGGAGAVCVAGHDPDRSQDAQMASMIANLKRVADEAARAGLLLLVEPIASARITGMLLDRLEPAVEIVRAVSMPSVRLMFDIGHVAMMGHDVVDALEACRDVIGLVQATDIDGRERLDVGLGTLDWAAIGERLRAIGYAGPVELEFEPSDPSAEGEAAMVARMEALL